MACVVLENVGKVFSSAGGRVVAAVRDLNLVVADGEFVVLVGPSGSGKSTTLRLVAGLEEVGEGTISIDGRVVNLVEPGERDVAMVFQNHALYPHMTVYENLAFGLRFRKVSKLEIEERVGRMAGMLGLGGLMDRFPKALSGGERQRVAVGRAMVRDPKVFLFDEPLSNLDPQMRTRTRLELRRLHRRLKATTIYVTHDHVEAMTMGDRIVVMKDGEVRQVGAPLALYRAPADRFVASFIGSPPMNFFRGTAARRELGDSWVFRQAGEGGEGGFRVELGGWGGGLDGHRDLWLGIRPEDLELCDRVGGVGAIDALVEGVEALGAETLVHASTGGAGFVVRLTGHREIVVGSVVGVKIPVDRWHLFEADLGREVVVARGVGLTQ